MPSMLKPIGSRLISAAAAVALLSGAVVVSCSGDPLDKPTEPENRPNSRAMGQWQPDTTLTDPPECPAKLHDEYFVVGPDGKKYPTWHPSKVTDPDTDEECSFGHEHGTDPRNSFLWSALQQHFGYDSDGSGQIDGDELEVSGIPFGYVAEQYAAFAGGATRDQQHRAYKIAVANNVARSRILNGIVETYQLRCDQLLAFNQDTASADAFASNLHAITYAIDCSRGADAADYGSPKMIVSVLAAFGDPGVFAVGPVGEGGGTERFGTPVPANSPASTVPVGDEAAPQRYIPDRQRAFDAFVPAGSDSDLIAALSERWDAIVSIRTTGGTELARFDPGLETFDPSRYYDDATVSRLTRALPLCYSGLNGAGSLVTDPAQAGTIVQQVRGGNACSRLDPTGPSTPLTDRIAFTDRASTIKGCGRQVIFRDQRLANSAGNEVWYTDPFGTRAQSGRFTGAIKQLLARTSTATNVVLAPAESEVSAAATECNAASGVRVPPPGSGG